MMKPPRREPRVQHEWRGQEADAAFLAWALPADAVWFSIDGGRAANAIAGAKRKLRGIKAGVPDLFIAWNGKTLWIERKTPKGKVAQVQKDMMEALRRAGHFCAIARSTEEVEQAARQVGIPLRGTVGGLIGSVIGEAA